MKRTAVALAGIALAVSMTACGSNNDHDTKATPSATTEPKVNLHDSCPLVEAAMPDGGMGEASDWQTSAAELDKIAEAGDVETQNALEALQEAVALKAADPEFPESLDAERALIDALDNLAKRCAAVGSSALQ